MKANSLFILACAAGFAVSFWLRNELPGGIDYLPAVLGEPAQKNTRSGPFDAVYDGVRYRIEPEYEYELHGLVVSYRHHDGESRMHRRANDHLNMLDVCVIWGDNTANPRLDRIDFWNGIFTCNVRTRDQAAWDAFDMYQLSNNHLLSADEFLRDKVQAVHIGDQIRIRGYLASYASDNGSRRGTSTTRLDTGDGACETIFVQDFDILRPAPASWRTAMIVFIVLLGIGIANHFRAPYRPYGAARTAL